MIAIELGLDKVIFESDCQLLIKSVEAKKSDLYDWRCRSTVQDIINLLASNVGFLISFVSRHYNSTAHFIAADSHKKVCPLGWVLSPTPSLSAILTEDAQKSYDSWSGNLSNTRMGVG